jgi:hypothetical protein
MTICEVENLECKRRKRFLVHLRSEIKKLCVVRKYVVIDELLVATIEMQKVLHEIGEKPYELLKMRKMRN